MSFFSTNEILTKRLSTNACFSSTQKFNISTIILYHQTSFFLRICYWWIMLQNQTHQVPSLVHSSVTFLNSDVMQCVLLIFPGSVPPKGAALSMQVNLNIHSHQSHPWTNSPQWISLIRKMSWLSKFIAVAFFVLYFVEQGAPVSAKTKAHKMSYCNCKVRWNLGKLPQT